MKKKAFALCSTAAAITGCDVDSDNDLNGAHAVAGAKELYYIQSSDVGAGSTWTADN
ncbi:hypothetical protein [Alteromonas sp. S015]|uniref:hypothetical protein n=1 Tax=Alteromonas sp. S015 TaxID=3117401 RepID=UPI002FDF11E6